MSNLRIYDKSGRLRETLEVVQKRIFDEEGAVLSLSQVAHRLIHSGKRSLDRAGEQRQA